MRFDLNSLQESYLDGRLTPSDAIREVYRRIEARGEDHVWEYLVPIDEALSAADKLPKRPSEDFPLYGVPFSVKDNIHVKGMPTTASCPAYSHIAGETAPVVSHLIECGAILIGKNTMDQFATGLVGVRRDGYPVNPFNPEYIPGGSSSGSAVAVAAHLVSFSLGSDTGGSGRVPAALNNIVGLKPTPCLLNTGGMVYANRSFDCLPIFALTCGDAKKVFECVRQTAARDPFMQYFPSDGGPPKTLGKDFKVGIPETSQLKFFGDKSAEIQFERACQRIKTLGASIETFDFQDFQEAGSLIFDGPLLAERLASIGPFLDDHPDEVHEVVKAIVVKAGSYSAVDLYNALHCLKELQARVLAMMDRFNVLMMPTTGTAYTAAEVLADPVTLNKNMGYYTYFANPLGLSVLAVPSSIKENGIPFGISFVSEPNQEAMLLHLGQLWENAVNIESGLTPGTREELYHVAE
jgi:allophanate hydrolase